MRIATPNWFFSIFGGGPEREVAYETNHLHAEITVNTPIKSNGKKIQLALLLVRHNKIEKIKKFIN